MKLATKSLDCLDMLASCGIIDLAPRQRHDVASTTRRHESSNTRAEITKTSRNDVRSVFAQLQRRRLGWEALDLDIGFDREDDLADVLPCADEAEGFLN